MTPDTTDTGVKLGIRKLGFVGGLTTFVLVGVLGAWSATTMISSAVIASGEAVVSGDVKTIQSLDGGIVNTIAVRNGDAVEAGQILVQLDPTLLETNIGIAHQRLGAALALKARLEAEQLDADTLVFNYPDLPFATPDTASAEAIQRAIFEARASVRTGREDQLIQTLAQYDSQQTGLEGQIAAVQAQVTLLEEDLANQQRLADQQLARGSDISQLQQQLADRAGQLASLEADLLQMDSARRAARLDLLQANRSFVEETATGLHAVNGEIEELVLELLTLNEQLARVDVRAPADGIIHQMQITTTGGILAPGGTILEIVPTQEEMAFDIRLDPRTIDKVYVGQPARMIIASVDSQLRPEYVAHVADISAGTITDPATGQTYYSATLALSDEELAAVEATEVLPGMPVEAFLEVQERSVLAYLVQPISQHLRRAFRE